MKVAELRKEAAALRLRELERVVCLMKVGQPLSPNDTATVIKLIEQVIAARRGAGRKPGSHSKNAVTTDNVNASNDLRQRKQDWRDKYKKRAVPSDVADRIAKEVHANHPKANLDTFKAMASRKTKRGHDGRVLPRRVRRRIAH